MYDTTNVHIIVCDAGLQQALQMSALHRKDIFYAVQQHLVWISLPPIDVLDLVPLYPTTQHLVIKPKAQNETPSPSFWSKNPYLKIDYRLYLVLTGNIPEFPYQRHLFCYHEVKFWVLMYIYQHPDVLDPGNHNILKTDACLKYLFNGLNYIHITQLDNFLRPLVFEQPPSFRNNHG